MIGRMSNKLVPLVLALSIALIAVGFYILSGRSGLDLASRQLNGDQEIESVEVENQNRISISCKNGESYQIIFTQAYTDYSDLIFNNCGPEGGEVLPE